MEQSHAIRLFPGDDLKAAIEQFVREEKIEAGWIATCIGSLTEFAIRFANSKTTTIGTGYFEILSVSGTVSANGCHLHIVIADQEGKNIGGHLMPGNRIYTTSELIIVSSKRFRFLRELDNETGSRELRIEKLG